MRVYRNDGSNRAYEATCTHLEPGGIALRTEAVFAVGEVVEFSFTSPERKESEQKKMDRHPARVIYRTSDRYGLGLLTKGVKNRKPVSAMNEQDCRLQTARQLLAELKASYNSLPPAHQEAVREAILEETVDPEVAA